MLGPHSLPPLLALRTDSSDVPIATADQWSTKCAQIKARYSQAFGVAPEARPPLCPEVLCEEDAGSYTRTKVRYQVEPGEYAPAWLLIPKGAPGPLPAMLCMHGTSAEGKDVPAGLAFLPTRHFAHELAQRGFVCLVPDCITAGERIYEGYGPYETEPFGKLHPEWSAMGKMLWDHQAALDYLQTLEFVDAERLGCIGHSLGGYNAFTLAAFDERMRMTVSSCAYVPFAADPEPKRWCRDSWFVHFEPMRAGLDAGEHPDFLWLEVLATLAPRGLFYNLGTQDAIFPGAVAVKDDLEELERLYDLLGASEMFDSYVFDGGHDFPDEARQKAYQMAERCLAKA
jgi:dienelactone hydrolase